jgi:hypothetical protein
MTKELSLICIFFVLFCLNIYSTWDNLSLVNPMLPFKQGLFFGNVLYRDILLLPLLLSRQAEGRTTPVAEN